MKLPNLEKAVVPREKVVDYLLSPTHRDGQHKAVFFMSFEFTVDTWETLASALHEHAAAHEIARIEESPFGTRYVIEGILNAADGRTPWVRSVWFIDTGNDIPRFVTAYPRGRKKND